MLTPTSQPYAALPACVQSLLTRTTVADDAHSDHSRREFSSAFHIRFVSERQAQLTRQAVNYIVRRRSSAASGPTCSGIPMGTTWPIRAPTYGPCRTTSATAIPSIPPNTSGLRGIGSKACGSSRGPSRPSLRLLSPMLSPHAPGRRGRPPRHALSCLRGTHQVLNGASLAGHWGSKSVIWDHAGDASGLPFSTT